MLDVLIIGLSNSKPVAFQLGVELLHQDRQTESYRQAAELRKD